MASSEVSICQYPTTTVFVDDNSHFISQVVALFKEKKLPGLFFVDPEKALNFLNNTYMPNPFINRCIIKNIDENSDHAASRLDIRTIHHEIYNSQRFNQISVVGTDFSMPVINGLDLCRKMTDNFSRKFMVTGEVALTLAVETFNENSIDKFIRKNSLDLSSLMLKCVVELQKKYFLQLTNVVRENQAIVMHQQVPPCLRDPVFVHFFNDLVEKYHIVEYYLLDKSGSFLFLDADAVPSWLIVRTEKEMDDIYDFAHDHCPIPEIDKALKNKEIISYFHTDEDFSVSYADSGCHRYLHPATKLISKKECYYYAYLTQPDAYYLARDKILSFNNYLKSL